MTDIKTLIDESPISRQQIAVIGLMPAQSFIAFAVPLLLVCASIVLLCSRAI